MARDRVARSNGSPGARVRSSLSVAELRQLIALMNRSDIQEITLEHELGGLRLTLRKPEPVIAPPVALESADSEQLELDALVESGGETPGHDALIEVRSPLVGIFRTAMKGDGKALVHEDDTVREGQVVAAVESLNVLNEVEVSVAGRVKRLLVSDGQAVEFGQPLLLVEPA
jgi:acetyl-CoA carboxylase biotin carboxyl carrier protein